MNNVECPYCNAEVVIDHDDGYGYEETIMHQQECYECEKTFAFTTSVSYHYTASKADCLNGGKHNYKPVVHIPRLWPEWMKCKSCDNETNGWRQDFK